jgi:hypothetical protein
MENIDSARVHANEALAWAREQENGLLPSEFDWRREYELRLQTVVSLLRRYHKQRQIATAILMGLLPR